MKQLSGWQTVLSWLVGVSVDERQSAINGPLYVSRFRGEWLVSTDHAVRGYGLRYQPFKTAFEFLSIWEKPIKNVLVLGAATGSIPTLLTRHDQQFEFDVVEPDESLQQLAQELLPEALKTQLRWHASTGIDFLQSTSNTYDLIVVDELEADTLTPALLKQSAVEQLKRHLAPNGQLLVHHPAGKHRLKQAANNYFEGTFKHVFRNALKRQIGDALVFIAQG